MRRGQYGRLQRKIGDIRRGILLKVTVWLCWYGAVGLWVEGLKWRL